MKHTDNQYIEEQILLLVDGELDPAQEQNVRDIIAGSPEYQELYDTYLSLKLEDEQDIVCTFKDELKKPETIAFVPAPKRSSRWPYYAAAALAPIAIISALWFGAQQEQVYKDNSLVKSQLPQNLNTALPPAQEPTGNNKSKNNTNTPVKRKTEKIVRKANPDPGTLALIRPEETAPEVQRTVRLLANQSTDISLATVQTSPIRPIAENNTTAMEDMTLALAKIAKDDHAPKGLLGDVINAGNWLLNEEKSTTVEISLGNFIHKSYTITLK
ncbi:hypothetical protein [Edaphocola aurantiacus]|uniref:hypothetical protein n=1 Tax=Edaphocola aurantiacus TaxID=2601682 RepID=UPI001C951CEC|nr:hypothetical protein [Edaphocola aurantiacus]